MKRLSMVLAVVTMMGGVFFASQSYADTFYASTDIASYTGTLTKYATPLDAQSHTNALGDPYAIPNRVTASPYDTPYRDMAIYVINNVPSYGNYNAIQTSWYYTTNQSTAPYSGYGNPNNTNTGFLQINDNGSTSVTSSKGSFSNFNGIYYSDFSLQVTGANANGDNAVARLWPAPLVGGVAELSAGTFLSYSLDATFGGLEGTVQDDWITSINHPTSVSGTFQGIFQNTSTTDPQYNGYYDINFTLGMDNWAYGQGTNLNGAFATSEFGTPVPVPGTLMLLGTGLVGLASLRLRRRRAGLAA